MTDFSMTAFQDRALEHVREIAVASGASEVEPFGPCQGDHETFVRGVLEHEARRVTVYLYPDEVGLSSGKNHWRIFEKPDYRSEEALLDAFSAALRRELVV